MVLCSGFENRVFPQAGLTRSAGTYASGARPRTRIRTAAAPSPWPFGSRGRSLAAGSPRSTMVQSRQNQFFRPGRPESCSVSQSLPLGGRCIRLPSFVLHSLPLTQPLVLPSARPAPPAPDPRPPKPADDDWDRVGFFGHAGHWGAEYAETDGGAGRRSRGRRSRRCTLVSRRRCARPASIAK